ncbi:hypothetical protein BDB01DRAFT_442155 [Pilobolus umbonatus]|nr:hypothetical protein BDB01DRAFT_442155 [Pilobolus umbonatus]
MSVICSICITSLLTEPSCSINCGHVFHEACIRKWITEGESRCPLCKKTASTSELRNTLYFSRTDRDFNDTQEDAQQQKTIEQLSAEIVVLKNENRQLTSDRKSDRLLIGRLRTSQEKLKEDHRTAEKALRYVKQLKRVADLDDYMNQPSTVAYLNKIKDTPTNDLLISVGALKGKFANMASERNQLEARVSHLQSIVADQKDKIRSLSNRLMADQRRDSSRAGYDPRQFKRQKKSEDTTMNDLIVLDSDTEDEGAIGYSQMTTDEEEGFTIELDTL